MLRSTLQGAQLLIILVGVFTVAYQPSAVFAQVVTLPNGVEIGVPLNPGDTNRDRLNGVGTPTFDTPVINSPSGGVGVTNPPGGVDAIADAATADAPQDTPPLVIDNPIYYWLFWFVISVFGKLLALGAMLFDVGLNQFVLGFGNLYYEKNVGVAIEETWAIVRDLFNLTFIFGLVFIGFKMILDSSDSKARSTLVSLIGAALLVNFSLFITKFIIDIANVAAGVIANGFTSVGSDANIANGFMNLLKISTFLNTSGDQFVDFQAGAAFGYIFGLLIFFAVAAFVFAAGGILMIIRFITLCAYMVFSPIMFIGWVFPSMQKHSSKYWSGFLGNAFFAPAYLIMLYLSYKVLSTYVYQIGNVNYGAVFAAGTDAGETAMKVIPFFIMTMVFLVMSLVVAKNMGAVGASTAISIGNKWRGSVQGGITSYAGRNTIGRASEWAAKKNDQLEGSRTGRNFKRAFSVATLGTITERERRNILEAGKKAKFGGSYSRSDDKAFAKEVKATRSRSAEQMRNEKIIQEGTEAQARLASGIAMDATTKTRLEERVEKLAMLAPNLSGAQIEAMSGAQLSALAPHLAPGQVEAIMKNEKISDDDKKKVTKARIDAIKKIIGSTTAVVSEEFTKLSIDQIETMGAEWVNLNAHKFSNSQFEDIKKSKKFSDTQRSNFATQRTQKFDAASNPTTASYANNSEIFQTRRGHRKPEDIAKLPAKVLMSDFAIPYLSDSVLKEIATKGSLTPGQQKDLEIKIKGSPVKNPTALRYFGTSHYTNNWG